MLSAPVLGGKKLNHCGFCSLYQQSAHTNKTSQPSRPHSEPPAAQYRKPFFFNVVHNTRQRDIVNTDRPNWQAFRAAQSRCDVGSCQTITWLRSDRDSSRLSVTTNCSKTQLAKTALSSTGISNDPAITLVDRPLLHTVSCYNRVCLIPNQPTT